jgi:hypothetical protein
VVFGDQKSPFVERGGDWRPNSPDWKSYLGALPVYIVATGLALLNPFAGLVVFLVPWIVWARLRYTSKDEESL